MTPHTDFFFQGANRGATLEALLYAITHDEGIVKVSGEVGSGKTMLCRVLMERLPATVETIYLANPSLSRDEILFAIGDELKLELEKGQTTRILRVLQEHLIRLFGEGRRVVVLIDEAHAMPNDTLEEIRLLSNLESNRHKLLQIVLFGQPELDEHLDTADMRQLRERITHSFRLEPLVRSDIENYIDFRMRAAGYRGPKVFNPGAIKLIANSSQGLTRRVNILSDKALLAAFAEGTHAVTRVEVKRAVRDSEFHRAWTGMQKTVLIGAAALVAGLALGWGTHMLLSAGGRSASAPGSAPAAASTAAAETPAARPAKAAVPIVSGLSLSASADPSTLKRSAETSTLAQPLPPERGELARGRFAVTQEWLRSAPGNHYAIHLAIVNSKELEQLEDFLLRASKTLPVGDLLVYSVKINGQQHYRVAYGSYAGPAEASDAIRGLPPQLSAYHPYYRSVERMRSQNRQ
jgi:type II secretory pathway predicted ATPase ExeA